jgi:hypothetical protein
MEASHTGGQVTAGVNEDILMLYWVWVYNDIEEVRCGWHKAPRRCYCRKILSLRPQHLSVAEESSWWVWGDLDVTLKNSV